MFTESTGTHGQTYRLTTQTKNPGTPLERTEYVVHRVTNRDELVWGRYFDNLDAATNHWLEKLRSH